MLIDLGDNKYYARYISNEFDSYLGGGKKDGVNKIELIFSTPISVNPEFFNKIKVIKGTSTPNVNILKGYVTNDRYSLIIEVDKHDYDHIMIDDDEPLNYHYTDSGKLVDSTKTNIHSLNSSKNIALLCNDKKKIKLFSYDNGSTILTDDNEIKKQQAVISNPGTNANDRTIALRQLESAKQALIRSTKSNYNRIALNHKSEIEINITLRVNYFKRQLENLYLLKKDS